MQTEQGYYKIRPSARLIHTIGSDLIGDVYAAIVELVKNSYDADASTVDISFKYLKKELKIIISDDGHGMSFDTVINKWLVPATDDKIDRKKSPKGRDFQGRKGIGRYAVSILGQELFLSTVNPKKEKTTILIDWGLFESKKYLEEIDLLVENSKTTEDQGTKLEITAKNDFIELWTEFEIDKLISELRKLISPLAEFNNDKFIINIDFENSPFPKYSNEIFEIESFPILKYYDYKISGTIEKNGDVNLLYENNSEENLPSQRIHKKIKLKRGKYSGKISLDLRVFDRDPEAIDNLINKGLIDPITGYFVKKRDARKLIDEVYGVNLYREKFRIRPYGNGGVDWLNLDKDRIQNPSLKISNNQVVGFVSIEPEEKSGLIEKSARDGLKENLNYFGLVELVRDALSELEIRRYKFRLKTGRGRNLSKNIENELIQLFNFADLSKKIQNKLSFLKIDKKVSDEITNIIKKEEDSKTQLLDDIKKTIAIYQGQATLGKIVTVILHEGRKPISYFRNQIPVLLNWTKNYRATHHEYYLKDIEEEFGNFDQQCKQLVELFSRLDPLARQNKGVKKDFNLKKSITKIVKIFHSELKTEGVIYEVNIDPKLTLYGWEDDLYIALSNLIENSLYWLNLNDSPSQKIEIFADKQENLLYIDFKDNGPGIEEDDIKSNIIFEPGYSKKMDGSGLGLAIAGEAITRLGGNLKAINSKMGAYFRIEINQQENEKET